MNKNNKNTLRLINKKVNQIVNKRLSIPSSPSLYRSLRYTFNIFKDIPANSYLHPALQCQTDANRKLKEIVIVLPVEEFHTKQLYYYTYTFYEATEPILYPNLPNQTSSLPPAINGLGYLTPNVESPSSLRAVMTLSSEASYLLSYSVYNPNSINTQNSILPLLYNDNPISYPFHQNIYALNDSTGQSLTFVMSIFKNGQVIIESKKKK